MYGPIYSVEIENATVAAASGDVDLFELIPGTDCVLVIHEIVIDVVSEVGDAEEEWLRLKLISGHTTTGNGTLTTPNCLNTKLGAPVSTCETNGATIATGGTAVDLRSFGFNVRNGLYYLPAPEHRIKIDESDSRLVLRNMAAVDDDIIANMTMLFEEL